MPAPNRDLASTAEPLVLANGRIDVRGHLYDLGNGVGGHETQPPPRVRPDWRGAGNNVACLRHARCQPERTTVAR